MGGSQSQENQSSTFSTIGLPPSSHYPPGPERTQPLSVSREDSSSTVRQHRRDQIYQSNTTAQSRDEESDEWLRVDAPPSTHAHAPPPPLPPRPHHSPDSRPTRIEPHPPPHSLREFNEYDLEQLLSTLHSLRLGSRRNTEGAQPEDEPGSDRTERRRRHHHSSTNGRQRHSRLRHPFLFLRPPAPNVNCPLCSKQFTSTDLEDHLPICSQRPRVQFNEDKLVHNAGECSICLDDMEAGDEIARLPCLCVYHLHCLRGWYKKSQTCPEHPDMKDV